jgi:3D (Asp-Asp-Asp) domain-containing protein
MRPLSFIASCLALLLMVSCSSPGSFTNGSTARAARIMSVKTTAYTHTESDHIQYGKKTAVGTQLRYGNVNSAAADWSVYPVGTVFKIEGMPGVYQVDDYGSALVGTNTLDLYKPSKTAMNNWGARKVNIQVLKWGSFRKSLNIMEDRQRFGHIRRMVDRIKRSI